MSKSGIKQRQLNLFGADKGYSDHDGSASKQSKSRSRLPTSGLKSGNHHSPVQDDVQLESLAKPKIKTIDVSPDPAAFFEDEISNDTPRFKKKLQTQSQQVTEEQSQSSA